MHQDMYILIIYRDIYAQSVYNRESIYMCMSTQMYTGLHIWAYAHTYLNIYINIHKFMSCADICTHISRGYTCITRIFGHINMYAHIPPAHLFTHVFTHIICICVWTRDLNSAITDMVHMCPYSQESLTYLYS